MCMGQGLRKRIHQRTITGRHAFFHQGRKSSQKIHIHGLNGFVKGLGHNNHLLGAERGGRHGDGTDGDPFVHHRNAVFFPHRIADLHQSLGRAGDAIVYFGREAFEIIAGTIQQAQAKGDRAQIKVLVAQHLQDGKNFSLG